MTGGNAAVQGIAMLNPQRWGATSNTPRGGGGVSAGGWGVGANPTALPKLDEKDDGTIFEVGEDGDGDEDEDDTHHDEKHSGGNSAEEDPWAQKEKATATKHSCLFEHTFVFSVD